MADAAEVISMCSDGSIGGPNHATHRSHALELEPNIFTWEDLMRNADSSLQCSERSLRHKVFQNARVLLRLMWNSKLSCASVYAQGLVDSR
ncbi:DUF3175 domain-containing protein [Synechococcus sp. HJ21-Hayes]|nr:DUF3175 domain-containing protein [Synechococcus sp. JJ3a-Johnson]MCP9853241.1 DUF3175 domain-containing protein [Synechococcus sp. HJ21-Hayes]